METNPNIALVQAAYANFTTGDIPALLAKLVDDVIWNDPGAPGIPYAGLYRGRDQVSLFFQRMDQTTEVLRFEPKDFLATGNMVAVFGWWQAKAKDTGRIFESDWAMRFEIRDGLISSFQAYVDTAAEAAAYGIAAVAA